MGIYSIYFTAPSFCNASWPFDVKVLEDIRGDMDTYWPDIEVVSSHQIL